MSLHYKKLKKIGFTLIEVMVTMSIISLLSSVVFSSTKNAKDRAVDSATEAQGGQFRTALALYKNDNGNYPKADSAQTISLSGRDFNVACLGTGCILNSEPVAPLPSGTLTKYIDDTQATIAPQIITDGEVQKGIFLLSCSDFEICGDETYIMSTVTQPSDGGCTGACVLSGSGGSLVISNPGAGSGGSGAVGGTCSDPAYNTTSEALCEAGGICEDLQGAPRNECGICSGMNYLYTDEDSCITAGICYAYGGGSLNPSYYNEAECTAEEHGHCDGNFNAYTGWPLQRTDPNRCNNAGACIRYDNMANGQFNDNQLACLDIDNGSCYQQGTSFSAMYTMGDGPSACTLAGFCSTGMGNLTMYEEECTSDIGNWYSYNNEWRLNNWISPGWSWQNNFWSSQNYFWTPYIWTQNAWTPPQQ